MSTFIFSNGIVFAAESCSQPVDVALVIDQSADMSGAKLESVKNASIDFIYKEDLPTSGLFSTSLAGSVADRDGFGYHQVGLVKFNNNIDSWNLTSDKAFIIGQISDLTDGSGSRNMTAALQTAMNFLSGENQNPYASKAIVIIVSGEPNSLDSAIEKVRIAKENIPSLRIIAIGVELDEISDESKRQAAYDFIRNENIFSSDCYFATRNETELSGCNSINSENLDESLSPIYQSITASVCDDTKPIVNVARIPERTIFSVDNFVLTSNATDDSGFSSHQIQWEISPPVLNGFFDECPVLGNNIFCNTGALGPFAPGTRIDFSATAFDLNGNKNNESADNFSIAKVTASIPALVRNKNLSISFYVNDLSALANLDNFYIGIDNGDLTGVVNYQDETSKVSSCHWDNSSYHCYYRYLNIPCPDAGAFSDESNLADIFYYAKTDGIYHNGPILSAFNIPITEPFEGNSFGNCFDGIDNDCNGKTDNEETVACDLGGPEITKIERISPPVANDVDETTGTVVILSEANDDNGIRVNQIQYRVQGAGAWTIITPICVDNNSDEKCDVDGQDVWSVTASIDISSYHPGTVIEFQSVVTDNSGNDNSTSSETKSFLIKSSECFNESDLDLCTSGQCCGGVCNTTAYNNPTNPYDEDDCTKKTCNGTRLEFEIDSSKDNLACDYEYSGTEYSTGCYSFQESYSSSSIFGTPLEYDYDAEGGCEHRDFKCNSGYCNSTVSGKIDDICGPDLLFTNYSCIGATRETSECVLNPDPPVDSPLCDLNFTYDWMIAYSSDDTVYSTDDTFLVGDSNEILYVGTVLDDKNVIIKVNASDSSGIEYVKIYWKNITAPTFTEIDCGCVVGATLCNCEKYIKLEEGYIGDIFQIYAESKDSVGNIAITYSDPGNPAEPDYYSFKVLDSDCEGMAPLTPCGPGADTSGRCCGNTCNLTISNPSSFDESCYEDSCDGTTWVPIINTDETICGAVGCSAFYSGCQDVNKCFSGYCSPSGVQVDSCGGINGDVFYDRGCSAGFCGDIFGGLDIECKESGDYDSDQTTGGTRCNCDCGGYDIEEKIYSSLELDGMNDYVSVGVFPKNKRFTISAWINGERSQNVGGIVFTNGESLGRWGLSLQSGKIVSLISNGVATDWWYIENYSEALYPFGWHLVTVTNDGIKRKFYRDGVFVSEHLNNLTNSGSTGSLNIGKGGSSDESYFKGSLDEVRIYDRALSSREVQDQFDGLYYDDSGLVGYWNLDEGLGDMSLDKSGNGNDGTIYYQNYLMKDGAVFQSGYNEIALELDGNGYVETSSFGIPATGQLTIMGWVKSSSVASEDQTLMGFANQSDIRLYRQANSNTLRWDAKYADTTSTLSINVDNFFDNSSDWIHFSVVRVDDFVTKIFKNGEIVALREHQKTILPNSNNSKYLGIYNPNDKKGLIGGLDEIKIYSRALSAGEVVSDKNSGSVDDTGLIRHWSFDDDIQDSPDWKKFHSESIGGLNANVSENWQVCTDGKNNDCDSDIDGGEFACDGQLDNIDIVAESRRLGITPAILSANIVAGVIDSVNVVSSGSGYAVAPSLEIIAGGIGSGAIVTAEIDIDGAISNVIVDSPGSDYSNVSVNISGGTLVEINKTDTFSFVPDSDVSTVLNNFKLSTSEGTADVHGIYQSYIEWTADNWFTTNRLTCSSGNCIVCVQGGECENSDTGNVTAASGKNITDDAKQWEINEWAGGVISITSGGEIVSSRDILSNDGNTIIATNNWLGDLPDFDSEYIVTKRADEIDLALLMTGKLFKYRACATDNSPNFNHKCTEVNSIDIIDNNTKPNVSNLNALNVDPCVYGLKYIFEWEFSDDDGDNQMYYQIQVKEGDSNFDIGPLVLNQRGGTSQYHILQEGEHKAMGTPESWLPKKLTDEDVSWVNDEWKDGIIKITAGGGVGIERIVKSNTANEIVVEGPASWSSDFDEFTEYEVKSVGLEYGEKTYYWRVKVADDNFGGLEKESDWELPAANAQFVTPLHQFPQVDFTAENDVLLDCFTTNHTDWCLAGQEIYFKDISVVSECLDDSQCLSSVKAQCDVDNRSCVACTSPSQCKKFGNYDCEAGVCEPADSFSCTDNSDCVSLNYPKCSLSICVLCDDDIDCEENFECNQGGHCVESIIRKWDLNGDFVTDSIESEPNRIYVGSEYDNFSIKLTRTDITGSTNMTCSKTKDMRLEGRRYPKWNEISTSN